MKENEQSEKFLRAARDLGCDESEAAFEDKLRQIAKPKPADEAEAKNDKAPE